MSTGDQYAGAEKRTSAGDSRTAVGPVDCTNLVSGDTARRMEGEKKIAITYVVAFQKCKFEHGRMKKGE